MLAEWGSAGLDISLAQVLINCEVHPRCLHYDHLAGEHGEHRILFATSVTEVFKLTRAILVDHGDGEPLRASWAHSRGLRRFSAICVVRE